MAQGDLTAALENYRADMAIAERLAASDPSNAGWQRELSISHNKIGDVLMSQGDLTAALENYRAAMAIAERLAASDPGNAEWQRDLIVGFAKLSQVTGDKAYAAKALDVALGMQQRGILAPRDAWFIEEFKRQLGR